MNRVVFLILIILMNSGCCKYEEGPLISFINPKYRITGNYTIEKFKVNEVDTTVFYKSQSCYSDISFIRTNDRGIIGNFGHNICTSGINGSWTVNDGGCILTMSRVVDIPILGPWGQFDNFNWTIIKLTDNGFIIGGKSLDDNYRIEETVN